jgi:hypothetical protein
MRSCVGRWAEFGLSRTGEMEARESNIHNSSLPLVSSPGISREARSNVWIELLNRYDYIVEHRKLIAHSSFNFCTAYGHYSAEFETENCNVKLLMLQTSELKLFNNLCIL